jgi:hypothetical protein
VPPRIKRRRLAGIHVSPFPRRGLDLAGGIDSGRRFRGRQFATRESRDVGGHSCSLSQNDRKIVLYGQLLTTIAHPTETTAFASLVESELDSIRPEPPVKRGDSQQKLLFREA